MLKPKARFKKVTDIKPEFFKENNIKAVILDVDNTLINLDKEPLENVENWIKKLKEVNIKICIASNSLKRKKVEKVANMLDIPYIYFSTKPLKRGLKKAIKLLKEKKENIAEIGDQLFTDVLGANRLGLYSILTEPISPEKYGISKIKRKIEKRVLDRVKK